MLGVSPLARSCRLLVGPAQRQTNGDRYFRRPLAHQRRGEAAGIVADVLERVELLGFDLELATQSLDQPGSVRGAPGHEHLVDAVDRARRLEEVERLLDLETDDLCHGFNDVPCFLRIDALDRVSVLERLSLREAEVEFFLYEIRVLMTADADIAGEQEVLPLHDVNGHDAG